MIEISFKRNILILGSLAVDFNTRRNKIILGSIALSIVLIIFIISISTSSGRCGFRSKKPGQADSKTLNANDNKALATFSGYIRYNYEDNTGSHGYLPLEFESVHLSWPPDSFNRRMTLETDCSTIEFDEMTDENGSDKYQIGEIRVKFSRPNGERRVCTIFSSSINIKASKIEHYACFDERTYPCYDFASVKVKEAAELVIQGFEFELDGNKKRIEERKFSTPRKYC